MSFSSDITFRKDFVDPPLDFAPRPLWFWNDVEVTEDTVREHMQLARDRCGFGGFGIIPFGERFRPEYLSEEYFKVYGVALETARELGMTMCLYDEYGFPSGSAGAIHGDGIPRFANRYPDQTIKRLDKIEVILKGSETISLPVPAEGKIMSVVAMEKQSLERLDLRKFISNDSLRWKAPPGEWRVMLFHCVVDGDPNVDYLDPHSVECFIEMTLQQYADRFKEHFGTTIDTTFNDEPTMYRANGRMWTDAFNDKFVARHGFDPALLYPALWYDIGPDNDAARNYLFGFRSELYSRGFPKVLQEWATKNGIEATGHQDQEEIINTVGVTGDLMLYFKYAAIPGIDKIGGDRPAERFYKVVSSAAYNWDRTQVMSETYGAMDDISWDEIYSIALDQFAKGINRFIPHAVWINDEAVKFPPQLSWQSPDYAEQLPHFSKLIGRLTMVLQPPARHVADIAVLYPIATLQAGHHFDGDLGFYAGGVTIEEADYIDVAEILTNDIGRDYTFIHPEVLDIKCVVENDMLHLQNVLNPESFSVMIIPGHRTIQWKSLRKIKEFYDNGGHVIATTCLPEKSAEFGHDADVVEVVAAMFDKSGVTSRNGRGGSATFIEKPGAAILRTALDNAVTVPDVKFDAGSELRYIHKVREGRDMYYFANITGRTVKTTVEIKNDIRPKVWDPHTGEIESTDWTTTSRNGVSTTQIDLVLEHNRSVFVIGS